jgi:hypothetical protein
MRRFIFTAGILCCMIHLHAQELNCNVQVVSQQVQGTNKQVFITMQTALYEFLNTRAWTSNVFRTEERIECNILINITEQVSADEFRGTMQVQCRRPVYGSSYNTVLLNYMDNNIQFRYVEYQPLEFDENSFQSNLTSLLAFYAYYIIGLDYDSFSLLGGTEYFQKAEKIVDNAQGAAEKGWKAFDGKSNRNRYWLIKDVLDKNYEPVREFYYRYHRLGLDVMSTKPNDGRAEIAESLKLLQKVYRNKPDVYLLFLQLLFDAKSDEFVNVFSESFPDELNRVLAILSEIDPSNTQKYSKLKK